MASYPIPTRIKRSNLGVRSDLAFQEMDADDEPSTGLWPIPIRSS